jgi:hypothetical protein
MNLEELNRRIEALHGCVIAQRLALQVILIHHPEALQTLQSIDLDKYEDLSMSRPLSDESIRAARDHLALLQHPAS